MLGQPLYMLTPQVVGFKLTGRLREGVTATDLVLTVTQQLRKKGVVEKFVEFYGPGLGAMSLADRATIANMAPEYGATCGFFPVDGETLNYLRRTGRPRGLVDLVERYCKEQGLFRTDDLPDPVFTDSLSLDLGDVEPSLAGPKRPQDRVPLEEDEVLLPRRARRPGEGPRLRPRKGRAGADGDHRDERRDVRAGPRRGGDRGHHELHQHVEPFGDARGRAAGPQGGRARLEGGAARQDQPGPRLEGGDGVPDAVGGDGRPRGPRLPRGRLRLHDLHRQQRAAPGRRPPRDQRGKLVASAVLSGNRNFEGRINPDVKANYLASPAAGRGLCPGRDHGAGHLEGRDRRRPRRTGGVPLRHLAEPEGGRRPGGRHRRADVRVHLRQRVRGQPDLERDPGGGGGPVRVRRGFDLHPGPAFLPGPHPRRAPGGRHPERADPRRPRRLRHHRSHLARGRHRGGEPRRPLPPRPGRAPRRTSTPTARGAATTA